MKLAEMGDAMTHVVGVDEAGRGSIIGEMMVAAYGVEESNLEALESLGVRDSKELGAESRRRLYRSLVRLGYPAVKAVPPSLIDRVNLNTLTEDAVCHVLRTVSSRLGGWRRIKVIVIDEFGRPERLSGRIRRMGFRGRIIIEPKADSRHPVVSAASIIAKHIRDTRIEVLRSIYGVEGSGYPSDDRTVRWLRGKAKSGELAPIVRYSWATLEGLGMRVRKDGLRDERLDRFMWGSGDG